MTYSIPMSIGATQGGLAAQGTAQQIAQPGLSSALKELFEEIVQNAQLSESLSSALGISVPKDAPGKEGESSLYGAVRSAIYRIRQSNGDLNQVLQHLSN